MLHGSKYFSAKEFACADGCGFGMKDDDIAPNLVHFLHTIRAKLAVPFYITSGARCEKHNKAVDGGMRSTHLPGGVGGPCSPEYTGQCRAADVSIEKWSMPIRGRAIQMALSLGLRVGIATGFIHFDVETEPYYTDGVWNYGSKENSSGGQ